MQSKRTGEQARSCGAGVVVKVAQGHAGGIGALEHGVGCVLSSSVEGGFQGLWTEGAGANTWAAARSGEGSSSSGEGAGGLCVEACAPSALLLSLSPESTCKWPFCGRGPPGGRVWF